MSEKFEILKTLALAKGEFEPLAKGVLAEVATLLELEALSLRISFLGEKEIVIPGMVLFLHTERRGRKS